jgi:hypothetical protein
VIYEYTVERHTFASKCHKHKTRGNHPDSKMVPPLAQACRQTYAEFLPVHRRLSKHHICIDDFVEYTKIVFPTENVDLDAIQEYKGTICIGIPWFRKPQTPGVEMSAEDFEFDLLPLMHFFDKAPGVKLRFTSAPSISWIRDCNPMPFLGSLFQRSAPTYMRWALDHRATEFKAIREPLIRHNNFNIRYSVKLQNAHAPAWLGGEFLGAMSRVVGRYYSRVYYDVQTASRLGMNILRPGWADENLTHRRLTVLVRPRRELTVWFWYRARTAPLPQPA